MKTPILILSAFALVALAPLAFGYPLDAYEETGMLRLEAYRLAQTGKVKGRLLPPGGRLDSEAIQLRLLDRPDFEIPAPDPELSAALLSLLGEDADGYAIAMLDLTDPAKPRYAGHNPEQNQNPGSVGKLMVGLAWFQALADIYPDDTAARDALLYETHHVADAFIRSDGHKVPFWKPGDSEVVYRPIQEGDDGNLWTWLDWMMSSSSNAAASTVMSQLVLLSHFGTAYPVPVETAAKFFAETPKSKLSSIYTKAIQSPLTRNGLDVGKLRQGSFFTREGKARIPGTNSAATPLELLRYMVAMEKGQLVDPYSSLALKRLIYLSEGRIRYASSPALRRAALYFKSGSLYSCKEEPGFQCGKYRGNVRNYLNSVTMVETDEPGRRLQYIVVLLSNVLRKDSAQIHKQLATDIHELMERDHPVQEVSPDRKPTLDDGSDEAAIQRAIDEINSEMAPAPVDEIDSDESDVSEPPGSR
ncbi:MAG: hypothetical protein JRF15_17130 [Deltaproteobacteria bacterium]|nr:hypothetical protein [Deltaproteobacteria bacterium]